MVQAHATPNLAVDPVFDRPCARHSIRYAGGFVSALRTRDWWFPVLRPTATQNLSRWRIAFAFGYRVRHRWGLATESGALACPCLFRGDTPVLVSVGDGGIVFPLAADPLTHLKLGPWDPCGAFNIVVQTQG
jgi:hypothetical protein